MHTAIRAARKGCLQLFLGVLLAPFFTVTVATIASAATPLAPVRMLVQPGDSVEIRGFRGQVEYIGSATAKDVVVEVKPVFTAPSVRGPAAVEIDQDEWQFVFKREGSVIQVAVDGPTSKQLWSELLVSNAIPEFNIKVTGPSLPLNINWNEGRISVPNVSAEVRVTAIKADVNVTKGEGAVVVANQEGSVAVRDRKGDVRIDSYLAKVDLSDIEGRVELENFTGDSRITQVNGNINLSSYKGTTRVSDAKGRLEFKNGNSPLHIEKFEGELRGRSAQGSVYAEVRGDANVRVESAEGAVNLRLPASGAWVNVGTEGGDLAVPSFLKLTRMSSQQVRTGRLKGATGGTVFVRTTTGDIRLK